MKLLHYGLQRSGTNFLESLLVGTFNVRFLNSNRDRRSPLQKHFRLYDNKDIVASPLYRNEISVTDFAHFESLLTKRPDHYLVISKDPYSWHISYQTWARKCSWPAVNHHYIQEYNLFYGKLLELSSQTDRFTFVRYVDLIRDTAGELEKLQSKLNLKRRFLARFSLSGPGKVSQSAQFTEERRAYYLEERYLDTYNKDSLQELNDHLDPRVASSLGYPVAELSS